MVKFSIEMDVITWEVTGDEANKEYLDENQDKINKYLDDLDYAMERIKNIEFLFKSESLQFKVVGEDMRESDMYFYRDNLGADKVTQDFYQMLIDKKFALVNELKNIIQRMAYLGWIVNFTQSVCNLLNKIWVIDQNLILKSYLLTEEV